MRPTKAGKLVVSFASLALCIAVVLPARAFPGPTWVEQGPGPTLFGQSEGIPNDPVSGAINAVAASATDPNLVYAGAVNGGVWKTTNATSPTPTWIPLTDHTLPALSINSLAISPVDPNTVFAGTGSTSSDAFEGSAGIGLARSTDGGATWTVLASGTFAGMQITNVVPTTLGGGNVVLAANLFQGGGVYRSADGGVTFDRISGAFGSGLPDAGVSSLVADPGSALRFYAAVPAVFGGGAAAGVYRSDDGGMTWTPESAGVTGLANSMRILLSVHNSVSGNAVYAAVITNAGTLSGVFRSANQGGSWTAMGVPSPPIYPGQQGIVHGALLADRTNPNVVFISGDRQDSPFPNVNGLSNFSANVFRGDASLLPGSPWQNIVGNGAQGTSPHADSRSMVFDADGSIIQGNDGGIYRLVDPNLPRTRIWVSMQGDIRPAETHSVAFDPVTHTVIAGAQDTGTTFQSAPGSFTWAEFLQGDGGVVAVDGDQSAHPGTSIRYSSFQSFGFFNRSTWDSAGNFMGFAPIGLNITSGPGAGLNLFSFDPNVQFFNPYVLNNVDPRRMLIGTANIYESTNQGDSLTDFGFTGFFIGALTYGSRDNGVPKPDVFYVGAGFTIYHRVTSGGPISALSNYPGGDVVGIVVDPQNYRHVFVLDDDQQVWSSFNEGATWQNLTANLPLLCDDAACIEVFSPSTSPLNTVLLVGGQGGVFQMRRPGAAGTTWTALSAGLPNALVADLHYDYATNTLVVGTLGRGAWTLTSFFRGGGGTGVLSVGGAARPGAARGSLGPAPVRVQDIRLPVQAPPPADRPARR